MPLLSAHNVIKLFKLSEPMLEILPVTPLVGVGANDVVVGIGTFARAEIAWIYLAPSADEDRPPVVHQPAPLGAGPSATAGATGTTADRRQSPSFTRRCG